MTLSKSEFIKQHLRSWFERITENLFVNQVSEFPIVLATDKGVHRSENQDRVAVMCGYRLDGAAYVVSVLSDGMGGMKNGGDCASITVSSFIAHIIENINSLGHNLEELLKGAAEAANQDVNDKYKQDGGATLSAVVYIEGEGYSIVNAGDSRVYLALPDELIQLSEDDTLAAQVNRPGDWPSNELLQYVGMGEDFQPHVIPFNNSSNSARFVLTSDGVHFMESKTIYQMVKSADNPKLLCRRLIELSKWLGSRDNASVLVLEPFENLANNNELTKGSNFYRVYDAYSVFDFMVFDEQKLPGANGLKSNNIEDVSGNKKIPRKKNKVMPKAEKDKKNVVSDKNSKPEGNEKSEKEDKKPQINISFE